ncbi:hypothetical protein LCGC14_2165160, partial [marine sediment metagenome]
MKRIDFSPFRCLSIRYSVNFRNSSLISMQSTLF